MCEELYKISILCIDSYENQVLSGWLSNPILDAAIPFRSTMEFLKEMESMMQSPQFPQSTSTNRRFRPLQPQQQKACSPTASTVQKGRLATFSLQIMFRQNSSWQGSLTWLEGKAEVYFRSALELLLLIDSAIDNVDACKTV